MYINSGTISAENKLNVEPNFYAYAEPETITINDYLTFNTGSLIGSHATLDSGSISASLEIDMSATGQIPNVSEPISIDLDLDMSAASGLITLSSGPIAMFGTLTASIVKPVPYCNDMRIDFQPQSITIDTCKEESTVDIERYKNDTYPLEIVFSRDGNSDISGLIFTLYTQLDGDTLYSSTGSIFDSTHGIVLFTFDPLAIDASGTGVYEIKVSGSDIATYAHGVFTIKDTLA